MRDDKKLPLFRRNGQRPKKAYVGRKLLSYFLLFAITFAFWFQIGFLFSVHMGSKIGLLAGMVGIDNGNIIESSNEVPWPWPEDWESYDFRDIRSRFNCQEYAHDQTKRLPTPEDWKVFQTAYINTVDSKATFNDPVPPGMGYTLIDQSPPPYYAKHSPGKGRGIFASRNIHKGELVHDGDKSDVMFPTGLSWKRFIFSLPRDRACDQIIWSWTQEREDGSFRIYSAINISILFNSGGDEEGNNISPESSVSSKFYATRDIKEGEELLYDYNVYDTDWDEVGV